MFLVTSCNVNINNSEKTRDKTHKEINPSLSTSLIYYKDSKIPEYARIAITMLASVGWLVENLVHPLS